MLIKFQQIYFTKVSLSKNILLDSSTSKKVLLKQQNAKYFKNENDTEKKGTSSTTSMIDI